MKYILTLLLIFLVFPLNLFAEEVDVSKTKRLTMEQYQFQNALYHYLRKDYLLSADTANAALNSPKAQEKERLLILLRQSDNEMLFGREYPSIAIPSDPVSDPLLFSLFDSAYKKSDYEGILQLGKEIGDNGASLYFKGISFLELKRIGEAKVAFQQVPPEHHLYPYARIALAQLKVMKQELKGAETDLRELLQQQNLNNAARDSLHLLIGQILFELGNPEAALNEFNNIPRESPFYRERLVKSGWSLVRLGADENAILLLNEANTLPLDTPEAREARALTGYSYIKLEKAEQAAVQFDALMRETEDAQKRLDALIEDGSLRSVYIKSLLGEPAPGLTPEQERHLFLLRKNPGVEIAIKHYRTIEELREGFLREERDLKEKRTYLKNVARGLEKTSQRVEKTIRKIRTVLQAGHKITDRDTRLGENLGGPNAQFLKSIEKIIYGMWKDILKRPINEDEKKIVKLIIYDGGENLECTNSPLVCPILEVMTTGRGKEVKRDEFLAMAKIIEVIGHDLARLEKNEEIYFEMIYTGLKSRVDNRLNLAKSVVDDSMGIDKRIKKGLGETERGLAMARSELDAQTIGAFTKLKFEIADFKHVVEAGRDKAKDIVKKEAATPVKKQ